MTQPSDAARKGFLTARPLPPGTGAGFVAGLRRIDLGSRRDRLIFVPPGLRGDRPAPLLVLLHGAGATADDILPIFRNAAERHGIILAVPTSQGATWDVMLAGYGRDVAIIDGLLRDAFATGAVDPARIAIGGFSDGASYALSLGVANGTLFSTILAFSPGFLAPPARKGTPRIFICHGTGDTVLPIDRCSRRLVPPLERAGYAVRYREFAGSHFVPDAMIEEGFGWFAGSIP